MNQILYTGKSKGPASIKSILKSFAIFIIVFGIIFIGDGSYALYSNYQLAHPKEDNTIPQISFEQEENNAIVKIDHNKGISRISYHWNDEVETIITGNSQETAILDNISIPAGINTLYVSATDINNKTAESSYEYAYDGICIELAVIDSSYMRITASDVTGLSYITYKWNNDEEITATPESAENSTFIQQITEIPTGLNTLSITAVNSSNKTLTKTQDVRGIHAPVIKLYIQGNDLVVMVTDEEGIAEIRQQINVEEEQIIPVPDGAKSFSYRYDIADEEDVLVTITAVDIEGVSRTYKGKNY